MVPNKFFELLIVTLALSGLSMVATADDLLTMVGSVGMGYDSNIYRTPDKAYTFGVTPPQNLHSGAFVPMDFSLEYNETGRELTGYFADFDIGGDFYVDGDVDNANTLKMDAGVGGYFLTDAEARVFVRRSDRNYFDKDTGLNQVSSVTGEDLSEKYSYTSFGTEFEYRFSVDRQWDFLVGLIYEDLNYDAPPRGFEYDHNLTKLFARADFSPTKTSKFKIRLDQYTRSYDSREARNLNASTAGARPKLEYNFLDINLEWRQRLTPNLVGYLSYDISNRTDQDVGYNDRTRNALALRLRYKINADMDTRIKIATTDADYDNAWAYDDPASGLRKTYSRTYVNWSLDYQLPNDLTVGAEVRIYDADSNDTRYDYERNETMFGITKAW